MIALLSIVLLVTTTFILKVLQYVEEKTMTYKAIAPQTDDDDNEEKLALRLSGLSLSGNDSQSRLNIGSYIPSSNGRSIGNIVSKEIKGKTNVSRGRALYLLALNTERKETLE